MVLVVINNCTLFLSLRCFYTCCLSMQLDMHYLLSKKLKRLECCYLRFVY